MKHGKRYLNSAAKITEGKKYSVEEACRLVKDCHFAKFDETVDLSV
ncbi:50S ribosomal protein L1, partial [Candidatus Sumerlaeota bacterium]|nr:50S ribosomal protein L1 [Candidatus Sumerlaeota bacterium]